MRSLRQEHARLSELLMLLSRECSALERDPRTVAPLLREALQYVVQHTNVHHHPREEVLFERLARRSPRYRALRDALAHEHEATGRVGESTLRALEAVESARGSSLESVASLARTIDRFAQEMRDHIVREEEILYSGAEQQLESGDWQAVEALRDMPDPLVVRDSRHSYPRLRANLRESERRVHGGPPTTFERWRMDETLDRFGDGVAWMRQVSSMGPSDKVWLGVRAMWAMTLAASPWPWWRLVATALAPGLATSRPLARRTRQVAARRRNAR